jgi:hypothetical protein
LLPYKFSDRGKQKKLPTNDAAENNQLNYPSATVPLTIEGNGQALCLSLPLFYLHQFVCK